MTMTGTIEELFQTPGAMKFVLNCKENPKADAGHFRITFAPEETIANGGASSAKLKAVPLPAGEPSYAVP